MSSRALRAQRRDELRHQRLVAGGQGRHADHVDVVLDRLPRRLLRASGTAGRCRRRSPGRRSAVAMTLAPRSWPSWPSLATMIRGRRPSSAAKALDLGLELRPRARRSRTPRRRRRRRSRCAARWRPNTFSSASEISPTVARSARRPRPPGRAGCRCRSRAAAVSAASAAVDRGGVALGADRGEARRAAPRAPRCCRSRGCRAGLPAPSRYLLTPTMTSSPRSMRACFSAAHSSIRSFAQPLSTALVMPPIASTSSMIAHALSAMSCVSFSIR